MGHLGAEPYQEQPGRPTRIRPCPLLIPNDIQLIVEYDGGISGGHQFVVPRLLSLTAFSHGLPLNDVRDNLVKLRLKAAEIKPLEPRLDCSRGTRRRGEYPLYNFILLGWIDLYD